MEQRISIERLEQAINLFGSFDENIRLIESEFHVTVANREGELRVNGEPEDTMLACKALSALLTLSNRGEAINEQNVRYVIGLARSGQEEKIGELTQDVICISAKGRPIKPKTIGQKEYVDSISQNTVTIGVGPAGTGKTYLSSCIANYALARGKTVYYQTAFQLFDLLEKLKFGRYDGDDLEQAEYTSRYVYQTDLLIIDDLGTEFISAYSTAALFDIINTRQIQEKSTILSTNLTAAGLEQIYSKRLTSRLMGNYTVLPFVGRDLRMRKFQSPNK